MDQLDSIIASTLVAPEDLIALDMESGEDSIIRTINRYSDVSLFEFAMSHLLNFYCDGMVLRDRIHRYEIGRLFGPHAIT